MKRKKITIQEISNIAGGYHNFRRVTRTNYYVKGWLYFMDKRLTDEEKLFVLSFKNTEILHCFKSCAPEIKYDVIFQGDKCFRRIYR